MNPNSVVTGSRGQGGRQIAAVVDPDFARRVRIQAATEDRAVAQLIIDALKRYLEAQA